MPLASLTHSHQHLSPEWHVYDQWWAHVDTLSNVPLLHPQGFHAMLVIVGVHSGLGRTVDCFPPLELAWYPYPLPQSRLASLPLPQPTSRLQTVPFLPVLQPTCPSHTKSRYSTQPNLTPYSKLGPGHTTAHQPTRLRSTYAVSSF